MNDQTCHDQDQADYGGRQDCLSHQEVNKNKGHKWRKIDEVADLGGCSGQAQSHEPENKGYAHFKDAYIHCSVKSPDIFETKGCDKGKEDGNVYKSCAEVEKQLENWVQAVHGIVNPVERPDYCASQSQNYSKGIGKFKPQDIAPGRDNQRSAVADNDGQDLNACDFLLQQGD